MAAGLELDHVAFRVGDAARTLAFYRDVLGLTLVDALAGDDWDGYPWLMMIFDDRGGRQLALTALAGAPPAAPPVPRDAVHHAFGVESLAELAAWKGRLRAAGVELREEDHGAQRSVYFADPSGNTLEITLRPRGAAPSADAERVIERWLAR